MRIFYDIVSLCGKYRGIDRTLLATDIPLLSKKTGYLLDLYYESIDLTTNKWYSKDSLLRLLSIEKVFLDHHVSCEVIAWSTQTIQNAYGFSVQYLGIDIVHLMSESLLVNQENPVILEQMNNNGLLEDVNSVYSIVQLSEHGYVDWQPCYVYQVLSGFK